MIAVTSTQAPAAAQSCLQGDFICATVGHHSPDTGFDAPFKVICDPKKGKNYRIRLDEGEVSDSFTKNGRRCNDVSGFVLAPHTRLHCGDHNGDWSYWAVNTTNQRKKVALRSNPTLTCNNQVA